MRLVSKIALVVSLSSTAPAVLAGAHTWDVWEVFSNADGTVQFVEIRETGGGAFETGIGGHAMIAMPSESTATMKVSRNWPSGTNGEKTLSVPGAGCLVPGAVPGASCWVPRASGVSPVAPEGAKGADDVGTACRQRLG